MPKAKYQNEAQRTEARNLAMLEHQARKRELTIKAAGDKCSICGFDGIDALGITARGLECANCERIDKRVAARNTLALRRHALKQGRIDTWKEDMIVPSQPIPKEVEQGMRDAIAAQKAREKEAYSKAILVPMPPPHKPMRVVGSQTPVEPANPMDAYVATVPIPGR